MNKAFFLDRDGTLNVDYNYVHKPEEWTWCNGALNALRWMLEQNFKIIVVTNQSGIARKRYTEQDVQRLHRWVDEQLAKRAYILMTGTTLHTIPRLTPTFNILLKTASRVRVCLKKLQPNIKLTSADHTW